MNATSFRRLALLGGFMVFLTVTDGMAQPGLNGGKPIITYNTTGPISIETQSPPAFPGGEDKLVVFVLESIADRETPIRLGRKTWLTATINEEGKVVSLAPTYENDPTLKQEIARVGERMPRWTPGLINQKGVPTQYQFLVRRPAN